MFTSNNSLIEKLDHELKQNRENFADCIFYTAGRHQFRSLWTRDFCFSIPALIKLNRAPEAYSGVKLLISNRHPELGLIPRSLDSSKTQYRVFREVILQTLGFHKELKISAHLKPEYFGEHNTPAFDSNLLVMISWLDLAEENSQACEDLKNEIAIFQQLYDFYKSSNQNKLLHQPAYSDWQDGVRREGKTSYINTLWWILHTKIEKHHLKIRTQFTARDIFSELKQVFYNYDSGLYQAVENQECFSLETQLFLIENLMKLKDTESARKLYHALIKSPLWKSPLPGRATYPQYPTEQKSWTTKIVGLSGYHDLLIWSWLLAESYKICCLMKDEQEKNKLKPILYQMINQGVSEVYVFQNNRLQEWHSRLLKSEKPFSWGLAKTIEAIFISEIS